MNNTQIDNGKNFDVKMAMYSLTEHSNNYSKTSGSLWQYYRDEPFLNNNGAIGDFSVANNNTDLFIFKQKITGKTAAGGTRWCH